jgi:hypothetical protein
LTTTFVAIPEAARRKRRDLYKEGNTDQRGRFTIHGLNPGHYTVAENDSSSSGSI